MVRKTTGIFIGHNSYEEGYMQIYRLAEEEGKAFFERLVYRFQALPRQYEEQVQEIISQVREKGDDALVEYTRKFDCPDFRKDLLQVPAQEIEAAYAQIEPEVLEAIKLSIRNVRRFHQEQKSKSWFLPQDHGGVVGQLVRPVERAGLYVPGGQGGETPLVSTVIMTAVPAKVAGVERVVMVSPPNKAGKLHPALLVAAAESGVDEIYRVGSAWAIAALAYGTPTLPRVEVVCGPGNIYVTLAKKLLAGEVGIDLVAGPSEILIVADDTAKPSWLAADLLSQAEHDPLATAVLVTPSENLAKKTIREVERQLKKLPRKEIAEKALANQGGILVVADVAEALLVANVLAPEHLELAVADPWKWVTKVKNAGAVFLGHHSPEALGDYVAGPNHVLPTMGCARYASALSVEVFLKKISIIAYPAEALKEEAWAVTKLARLEGLEAHARAVEKRL